MLNRLFVCLATAQSAHCACMHVLSISCDSPKSRQVALSRFKRAASKVIKENRGRHIYGLVQSVRVGMLEDQNRLVSIAPKRPVDADILPRAMPFSEDQYRGPWRFNDSVFAGYYEPSSKDLEEMFYEDWNVTKVSNFIKDPTELNATAQVCVCRAAPHSVSLPVSLPSSPPHIPPSPTDVAATLWPHHVHIQVVLCRRRRRCVLPLVECL